jgi:hypothetical protein
MIVKVGAAATGSYFGDGCTALNGLSVHWVVMTQEHIRTRTGTEQPAPSTISARSTNCHINPIGPAGFEPTTSCTPSNESVIGEV